MHASQLCRAVTPSVGTVGTGDGRGLSQRRKCVCYLKVSTRPAGKWCLVLYT